MPAEKKTNKYIANKTYFRRNFIPSERHSVESATNISLMRKPPGISRRDKSGRLQCSCYGLNMEF